MIAHAMDALYNDREMARAMGEAGNERIQELGINWDHVTARLLA